MYSLKIVCLFYFIYLFYFKFRSYGFGKTNLENTSFDECSQVIKKELLTKNFLLLINKLKTYEIEFENQIILNENLNLEIIQNIYQKKEIEKEKKELEKEKKKLEKEKKRT
jgi:hypothetical protein